MAGLVIEPVMAGQAEMRLPALRDDIELLPGPTLADGAPSWQIHDPARSRFFRIGWSEFEILSRWHLRTVQAIVAAVEANTCLCIDAQQVESLADFLLQQQLLRVDDSGGVTRLQHIARSLRPPLLKQVLHNYLFFRIPLWRPDRFLQHTLPLVEPLFSRGFAWLLLFFSMTGVYLVSRQWDSFVNSYLYLQTWDGILLVACAVLFSKLLHELAHAYVAKRHGAQVPVIGVAFLVLWPVLYTETSDTWRLPQRRSRLQVAGAGMLAELSLAIIASFLWGIMPEGEARTAMFLLAGTTWIMTLAINLNPFMRFDGYFLLADWLGIPNLHERSFALARWQLRRSLLGWQQACPENFGIRQRRLMIVFAWAVWLYRLLLFIGIALLVYHLFFKLLGILLMIVELTWFVALPVWREMREWYRQREHFHWNLRLLLSMSVLLGLLLWVVVPRSHLLLLPATVQQEPVQTLHAAMPARVQDVLVQAGQRVQKGQLLVQLHAPELDQQLLREQAAVKSAREVLARLQTSPQERAYLAVAQEQLAEASARLRAMQQRQQQLSLLSPFAGVVADVHPELHYHPWVNEQLSLLRVVSEQGQTVTAYIEAEELAYFNADQQATFYPDDLSQRPLALRFEQVDQSASLILPNGYLASVHGGPLAVRDAQLQPERSLYRVHFQVADKAVPVTQVLIGRVRMQTTPYSYAMAAWRHVLAVLQRESGF